MIAVYTDISPAWCGSSQADEDDVCGYYNIARGNVGIVLDESEDEYFLVVGSQVKEVSFNEFIEEVITQCRKRDRDVPTS